MIGPAKLVGARVKRSEDPRLVSGNGRYVSGMTLPKMAEMVLLRSPHARARIRSIDTTNARTQPGVLKIFTGLELADSLGPLKAKLDPEKNPNFKSCDWYPLARDEVRHVGDAVAAIIAEDRYLAEDALDQIEVDYEILEPVLDPELALKPQSELVHEEWGDNIMHRVEAKIGEPDEVFANAHTVVHRRFRTNRQHALPLEPRCCLAVHEPISDELTLWDSHQMPHMLRTQLAQHLGYRENKVRIISPDVGGGFGLKAHYFPEEALASLATRALQRPVRWLEDRRESFVASFHSKEQIVDGALATDGDGKILAARFDAISDVGAYSAVPWTSTFEVLHAAQMFPGPYRINSYSFSATAVSTHKTTSSVYRGVGAPVETFVMEGLLDVVAQKLDLDPVDIRRRNLITKEEFPYQSCTGMEYESGSYIECLEKAAELSEYDSFRLGQIDLRKRGVYRGIGVSCYNEITALGSTFFQDAGIPISSYEAANIKMDPQGRITIFMGTHSHGQAHETVFAQIASDELGIPFDRITVQLGDTQTTPYGFGSGASRAAVIGGGAVIGASQRLAEKIRRIAGHYLEVSPNDIELENGAAKVKGVPGRELLISEIAKRAIFTAAADLPEGEEPGLEATHYYEPPPVTFPNATHIAQVQVDIETGVVTILRYVVVEDCGRMINPMVVDGQITGGVAQGLGGALLEHLVYDDAGQLLTTSLADYLVPSAADTPFIEIGHIETPSPLVPGGFKGAGEGGAIAPWGAIANAVSDALGKPGVQATELPLTPERIRSLAQAS